MPFYFSLVSPPSFLIFLEQVPNSLHNQLIEGLHLSSPAESIRTPVPPGAAGGPDPSALPSPPAGYVPNRPTSDSQPVDSAHGSRHVEPCRLTVLRNIYPTSPCDPRIHDVPFGREERHQIVLRASSGTQGVLPSNWLVLGMVTTFQ